MMNRFIHATAGVCFLLLLSACRKDPLPPFPEDSGIFDACVVPGSPGTLDIVTFNLEGFPKEGYTSVAAIASLVKAMDPDIIALQEIASQADFNRLLHLLPGWTGRFYLLDNDDWNLAWLIKNSEAEIISSSPRLLFEDDLWAFPRPPFEIAVRHKPRNRDIFLVNLHLKCCGGAENESRRQLASEKLKQYLDTSRPSDPVVILGDFNDEIASLNPLDNPFLNFISDTAGYLFADLAIARGSALWWSYPSYPSHIDHILVTNELASLIETTLVIKASPCYPDYNAHISDHRPVMMKLRATP